MKSACVVLDCGPLQRPTLATIDQIARLHIAVRRRGCRLELRNVNPCLCELVGFAGLSEVLRVEPRWQAEEGKHPRRVQEEGELRYPSA